VEIKSGFISIYILEAIDEGESIQYQATVSARNFIIKEVMLKKIS